MLQRLVLYSTLGWVMNLAGHDFLSWEFWCVMGLYLAADMMSRREGYESGIWDAVNMPQRDIDNIKKLIKEEEES